MSSERERKPIPDPNSAALPVFIFVCCLSKDPKIQPQCKYYKPGRLKFCSSLGNWWEGHQRCMNKEARQGYIDAVKAEAAAVEPQQRGGDLG